MLSIGRYELKDIRLNRTLLLSTPLFTEQFSPKNVKPKLSDSPYLTRKAKMPQTLLECDTLKVWAIDFKLSPNR
jgi:hypothetical protein